MASQTSDQLKDDLLTALHDNELRVAMQSGRAGARARRLAHFKRAADTNAVDLNFRNRLGSDPESALNEINADLDPAMCRYLWGSNRTAEEIMANMPEELADYNAFISAKLQHLKHVCETVVPQSPVWAQWRQRQIARCRSELPNTNSKVIHAAAAFELNEGCTVGCWFCGVGAEKFRRAGPYADHRHTWRKLLTTVAEVGGGPNLTAFAYWATEPIDNPDYEQYCMDMVDVLGYYPQTTTAVAMRDPERTRAILHQSAKHGCVMNRFSILTSRIYQRALDFFSPNELLFVEIIPQNKGSATVKSFSGHARRRKEESEDFRRSVAPDPFAPEEKQVVQHETIACVSGFLVNVPMKQIKLITPCAASEAYPLGYITLAAETFSNDEEVAEIMHRMASDCMTVLLDTEKPIAFRRDIRLKPDANGFVLQTAKSHVTVSHPHHGQYFNDLGQLIAEGGLTPAAISAQLAARHRISSDETISVMRKLFESGVIAEGVSPDSTAMVTSE